MRSAFRRLIVRADEWLARYIDGQVCAPLYEMEERSISPDRIVCCEAAVTDLLLHPVTFEYLSMVPRG